MTDLFYDLHQAVTQLDGMYRDLGTTLADERAYKMSGWNQSRESSVSGRSMDADFFAVEYSKLVLMAQFDVKALEMRVEYIKYLIDHGYTDYPALPDLIPGPGA